MPALALTLAGRTRYLPDDDTHRPDAMRRYWEAQQSGDATARLVRVDEVPPGAANGDFPDDDPPPAAPAASIPAVAPGLVSLVAKERIQLQETWLAKGGFALAPPIYVPGTRVLPVGDRNFRLERERVERLPMFGDAAERVLAAIADERRRDEAAHARDVAMTERGTLLVSGQEHALELGAFFQLANLGGFGMGARYLAERCPPELRAVNVNAQLKRATPRRLTFRVRTGDNGPSIFATVTPTYTPVDTDAVLNVAAPHLTDAHVEMLYDGSGVRATALFLPDQVVDLAAGDVFKVGIRIETDDTGRGRVRVSAVVFRNRCLNLLVIGVGTVETVSVVHKGDASRILARVNEGIATARDKVGDFLEAFGHARRVRVEPKALLQTWVDEKKIGPVPPKERDATVAALLTAWEAEPGDTLADCVNAVARAAHEHPLWGMDFRAELERQAARLVYVGA